MPCWVKKRRDFLLVAKKGVRSSQRSFLLQALKKIPDDSVSPGLRFGFTATRKLGGAVVRNRARRRLRSAVVALKKAHFFSTTTVFSADCVLIARSPVIWQTFSDLVTDLKRALDSVFQDRRLKVAVRTDHP